MKYLLFSDIHGNDLALKILKSQGYFDNVDYVVCLGDAIAIGPSGHEVLEILKQIPNLLMVRGNHERYFLTGFDNPGSCTEISHQEWVWSKLDEDDRKFLEKLSFSIETEDNGYKLLFIHYAMKSATKYKSIIHNPDALILDELFKEYDADIICYGHEHVASCFKGDKLYINTGSLGCPVKKPLTLKAVILEITDDVKVENIEIEYDPTPVVKTMKQQMMPDREFISKSFFGINESEC